MKRQYKTFQVQVKNKVAKTSLFYTSGNNWTHHESFFAKYLDSFGTIINMQSVSYSAIDELATK